MYTSSNQRSPSNVLAAQCRTATTTAIGTTDEVANRGTRCSVSASTAVAATCVHVTVEAMPLGIDAQVLASLAPLLEAVGQTEAAPVGDVESRRVSGHRMFDYVATTWQPVTGVEVDRH